MPPAQSLAKLSVAVDGAPLDVAYGDNSHWTTHTVRVHRPAKPTRSSISKASCPARSWTASPSPKCRPELYYLPEVPLSDLYGEDAFGIWTLEIWDNRAGPVTTNAAQLLQWQLNFGLAPSNPPPVITLSHGIPYTNSLPAYGIQYFVVPVPQWATLATNTLQFAVQVRTTNPLPVTVLFNQTNYPSPADLALIGPLVSSGTTVLATNTTPPLVIGQTYYLAVTNPNPVGVTFALGVWFDITTLANCQMTTNCRRPGRHPALLPVRCPDQRPARRPPAPGRLLLALRRQQQPDGRPERAPAAPGPQPLRLHQPAALHE